MAFRKRGGKRRKSFKGKKRGIKKQYVTMPRGGIRL